MNNVILIDKQDNPLGTAEKILAHKTGKLHRAFSIFVFKKTNNKLQLLLQKRNINKYHSGGLWTNSCCGHPKLNQNTQLAAEQRLTEELGIKLNLTKLGTFVYKAKVSNDLIEHELDHVFISYFKENLSINPNPLEIDDWKWQNVLEFDDWISEYSNTNQITVWLKPAWEIIKSKVQLNP